MNEFPADCLSTREKSRYAAQLRMPDVGEQGQQRLKSASVAVIGTGGLGSPASIYLAAAGIGRLKLIDFDRVDESNLQRQILFDARDVGRRKIDAAATRLRAVNPLVEVIAIDSRLDHVNARTLLADCDVVLDASDNFATRYAVNEACVALDKPLVHGSVLRWEGQVSLFIAGGAPCYRCLFPEPPPPGLTPDCAQAGVFGATAGLIGTAMAAETLKWLLGLDGTLAGRLWIMDIRAMKSRDLSVKKDPTCPSCGPEGTRQPPAPVSACAAPSSGVPAISVAELKAALARTNPPFVLDVREPAELAESRIADSVNIPLGQLPARMAELDRGADIVIHCRGGGRSSKACELLIASGFPRVRNLTGGMLAWSAAP